MVISQVAQEECGSQAVSVHVMLDSRRAVAGWEVGENMNCPHCKGLVIPSEELCHGVKFRSYRCINCGRYYPVQTITNQPHIGERSPAIGSNRIPENLLATAKKFLDAGDCVTHAAKKVGISRVGLQYVVKKEGWQVTSGRPNRRAK